MVNSDAAYYFGAGFLFEKDEKEQTEERYHLLSSGKRTDTEKHFRGNSITLFENEQYPMAVRLSCSIPAFDAGDRLYDSWRDLFIARDRSGELYGMYAAGGYEIVTVRWLGKVFAYPEALKPFLE